MLRTSDLGLSIILVTPSSVEDYRYYQYYPCSLMALICRAAGYHWDTLAPGVLGLPETIQTQGIDWVPPATRAALIFSLIRAYT